MDSPPPPSFDRAAQQSWRGDRDDSSISQSNPASTAGQDSHTSLFATWREQPWNTVSIGRWLKTFFMRAFFTLLAVGLIILLFYSLLAVYHPTPLVAGFVTSAYPPIETPLLGTSDQETLSRLSQYKATFLTPPVISLDNVSKDLAEKSAEEMTDVLVKSLKATRPGGPEKNTAILYLSMAGTVDRRGRACLIPPVIYKNAAIDVEKNYLPIEVLFTRLRAAVDPKIHIIVILDCCRPGTWPLSIGDGAFAGGVEASLGAASLDRFWTVLPCSPGQTSDESPLHGSSAFAYFFAEGVQGAADRAPYGNRDRTVDLSELMAFLADRVDQWAHSACGVRQTPAIYPALKPNEAAITPKVSRIGFFSDRIKNVVKPNRKADVAGPSLEVDAIGSTRRNSWIKERWLVSESIRTLAISYKPLVWQKYLQVLLRAEKLCQIGGNSQELARIAAQVEQFENDLRSVRALQVDDLPSLRLAKLLDVNTSALSPEGNAILLRDGLAAYVTTIPDPKKPIPPWARAESSGQWKAGAMVAWDWLQDHVRSGSHIDHAALERWLECVGRQSIETAVDPQEIHVIRMMARWIDPAVWDASQPLMAELIGLVGMVGEACYAENIRADSFAERCSLLIKAEEAVREAIDLAMVGDPASIARAGELAREAEGVLGKCIELTDELSAAMALIDTLNDEVPWFIAYGVDVARGAIVRSSGRESFSGEFPLGNMDWQILIRKTNALRQELSATTDNVMEKSFSAFDEAIKAVRDSREAVEAEFLPLKASFLRHCEIMSNTSPDTPESLAAIRQILRTPLVRGDVRARLLQRAEILANRFGDLIASDAAGKLAKNDVPAAATTAGWISWNDFLVHPLIPFFIDDAQGPSARPATPIEVSQAVGDQIGRLVSAAQTLTEAVVDVGNGRNGMDRELEKAEVLDAESSESSDKALARAVDSTRRLSVVISQTDWSGTFEMRKGYRILWHNRFMSAARRTIGDFWAGVEPGDPHWYLAAARLFVLKADAVVSRYRAYRVQQRTDLLRQLEQLEKSEGGLLDLTTKPDSLTLHGPTISPAASANQTTLRRLTPGLPPGIGMVWLAVAENAKPLPIIGFGSSNGALPTTRLPCAIPSGDAPEAISWYVTAPPRIANVVDAPHTLDLVFWFRGHRIVRGLPVFGAASERTVGWRRQVMPAPRVSLHGYTARNQSVAVIFDASGSMGERLLDGRTRLESGREALYEVLNQMAEGGGWNASLWVYGHRTRWSRDTKGSYTAGFTELGQRERDAALKAGKKFALVPGDDVEQLMPMQPLSPLEVVTIRSTLDRLQPGGETPLYRAINESLRSDFALRDPGPGHVLVVTDGANEQSGGRMATVNEVIRTLSRVNARRTTPNEVRIDVIGFDMPPGECDREMRLQDLQSLAADSGGKYFDATDPGRLATALRRSLRLSRWGVEGAGAPAEKILLDHELRLREPPDGRTDTYDVVLDAGPSSPRRGISVSGGESLDLQVVGNGRALEFQRYTGGTEQGLRDSRSLIADPNDPRKRWFVGAHQVRREPQAVRFPLSIQNGDPTGFSPRPEEMWAEVRPRTADNALGAPYVFWDIEWQPSRPVPVIDLVAPAWPANAVAAEIRVWFRFKPTPPGTVIPLADLVPGVERVFDINNMPGSRVRLFLQPLGGEPEALLTVTEEHDSIPAGDLPVVRVAVPGSCTKVIHAWQPGTTQVQHSFTLATVRGQLAPNAACLITDRREILKGAVGLEDDLETAKPLSVPVPLE